MSNYTDEQRLTWLLSLGNQRRVNLDGTACGMPGQDRQAILREQIDWNLKREGIQPGTETMVQVVDGVMRPVPWKGDRAVEVLTVLAEKCVETSLQMRGDTSSNVMAGIGSALKAAAIELDAS